MFIGTLTLVILPCLENAALILLSSVSKERLPTNNSLLSSSSPFSFSSSSSSSSSLSCFFPFLVALDFETFDYFLTAFFGGSSSLSSLLSEDSSLELSFFAPFFAGAALAYGFLEITGTSSLLSSLSSSLDSFLPFLAAAAGYFPLAAVFPLLLADNFLAAALG
jgi:hypothetical protein